MPQAPAVYRFGRFRVDTREQRLTRDDEAIAITPKVFDTLVVFLDNPGRLLTKDELLQAIWPGTAVEEANLTVNVSTLRRLLADDETTPCIETVARRGYRFVRGVDVDREAVAPSADGRTDKPAGALAQELYARANQAAYEADHWETARDLYQACVEAAPDFAPAWARLARCHRLIAKYTVAAAVREAECSRAIAAFDRALTLDPSLPLAHNLYAQLEVDVGRALDASMRLVRLIQHHGPDAEAFAGLVHALRFCGLLAASRHAHDRARALDPTIVTSVAHTCWLLGDFETALQETAGDIGYLAGLTLASMGRRADAIAALRWRERDTRDNRVRAFLISLRAMLEGDRDESLAALARAADELTDPEARYHVARSYARLGVDDAALATLRAVVDGGYVCYPAITADAWFDSVRGDGEFDRLLTRAAAAHDAAERAFRNAGGPEILTGATAPL